MKKNINKYSLVVCTSFLLTSGYWLHQVIRHIILRAHIIFYYVLLSITYEFDELYRGY